MTSFFAFPGLPPKVHMVPPNFLEGWSFSNIQNCCKTNCLHMETRLLDFGFGKGKDIY